MLTLKNYSDSDIVKIIDNFRKCADVIGEDMSRYFIFFVPQNQNSKVFP